MKKINKTYLDNLVTKLINETLEEKADNLVSKIKKEVGEGEMAGEHPTFGKMNFSKMSDEDIDDLMRRSYDDSDDDFEDEEYTDEKFDDEDEFTFEEMDEEMGGSVCEQCKSEMKEGSSVCEQCGYTMESIYHRDENELPPVMDMDEDIYDESEPFGKDQSFDYVEEEMNEESEEDVENEEFCKYQLDNFGSDDERFQEKCGYMMESLVGGQKKLDKNKNNKIDAEDFKLLRKSKKKGGETDEEMEEGNAFTGALAKAKEKGEDEFNVDGKKYHVKEGRKSVNEKWKGKVDVEKSGEYGDMSIEEINSAIKKLKAKNEKTKEAGKKVSQADRTKMSQLYFAKRSKQGWKGKGTAAVKESIKLTENELISLIENIVKEQKAGMKTLGKPKGLTKYEQVHKADGKENDEYLKMVTKKMKDYLKDGSKGDFEMNPGHFPKGNGELAKMKKKAYIPSGAVQDYTDNFTAAALENLDYDGINPDEEWVSDNVEGSSRTGNNPKWANAVETDVNKKRNKIRKDNLLGKLKRKAYNKSPQPIVNDKSGENEGDKIMAKLESVNPKESKKLNEEFDKMKNLISYNRKTQ